MSEVNNVAAAAAPAIPLWLEFFRAIAPICAALIAGVVAWRFGVVQTRIAQKQSETAADKLRLDLFEKRLSVYQSASKYISKILIHGQSSANDDDEYWQGVASAVWVFGPEIDTYLRKTLWTLTSNLHEINEELKESEGQDRYNLGMRKLKLRRELREQHEVLVKLVKPYLHFPL